MTLDQCIDVLLKRGMLVEPDPREPERWLVFSPNDPAEIANGGHPDFFDSAGLIQMVEMYLLDLHIGDCPHHPYVALPGTA